MTKHEFKRKNKLCHFCATIVSDHKWHTKIHIYKWFTATCQISDLYQESELISGSVDDTRHNKWQKTSRNVSSCYSIGDVAQPGHCEKKNSAEPTIFQTCHN